MRLSIIILSLLTATSAFAKVPNVDGRLKKIDQIADKCLEEDASTMGTKMCLDQKMTASDALLNEVYKDMVKTLKSQAESEKGNEENDKFGEETLRRLVAAQRAWITFRDAECDYQGTTMLHGTGEGVMILSCLAEKTFKRVKELNDM